MVTATPLVAETPAAVAPPVLQILLTMHRRGEIGMQVRTQTGKVEPALVLETLRAALQAAEQHAAKLQSTILAPNGMRVR